MKDKIITIGFCFIIFGFLISSILIEDKEVSYFERRTLATFPTISLDDVLSLEFMSKLDKYLLDHFPLRDEFRNLKANVVFNVLESLDNNGIYIYENGIYSMDNNLDVDQVMSFAEKLNNITNTYFENNEVYYSIIFDKNNYVSSSYLNYDYNLLKDIIFNNISPTLSYIDIENLVNIDTFYNTDTHYSQDKIIDVVKNLAESMGVYLELDNLQESTFEPFYGVYYGQAALSFKPDVITYYTNDVINNALVYHHESNSYKDVYDLSKLGQMDSYDVFLSGASALITIENPLSTSDNELIIFRDSFSSAISPLLIEGYATIHLVDIRYMNSSNVFDYIEYDDDSDILFLYSTLVINNSSILRDR